MLKHFVLLVCVTHALTAQSKDLDSLRAVIRLTESALISISLDANCVCSSGDQPKTDRGGMTVRVLRESRPQGRSIATCSPHTVCSQDGLTRVDLDATYMFNGAYSVSWNRSSSTNGGARVPDQRCQVESNYSANLLCVGDATGWTATVWGCLERRSCRLSAALERDSAKWSVTASGESTTLHWRDNGEVPTECTWVLEEHNGYAAITSYERSVAGKVVERFRVVKMDLLRCGPRIPTEVVATVFDANGHEVESRHSVIAVLEENAHIDADVLRIELPEGTLLHNRDNGESIVVGSNSSELMRKVEQDSDVFRRAMLAGGEASSWNSVPWSWVCVLCAIGGLLGIMTFLKRRTRVAKGVASVVAVCALSLTAPRSQSDSTQDLLGPRNASITTDEQRIALQLQCGREVVERHVRLVNLSAARFAEPKSGRSRVVPNTLDWRGKAFDGAVLRRDVC